MTSRLLAGALFAALALDAHAQHHAIAQPTDAEREAARPPSRAHAAHDNAIQWFVLFDRLEFFDTDAGTGQTWSAKAWIGTDRHKLWLRSGGARSDGRTQVADLEVLYGRPISPWWDLVAGVRRSYAWERRFEPSTVPGLFSAALDAEGHIPIPCCAPRIVEAGDTQDWAAIGLVGVAPYKFEVEATAYVGDGGRTAAHIEAEYDLLFTNRLILQPAVEADLYGKDDPARGIGAGLSTMEAGLRLRYEITRKFAPYVGVVHERAFGGTADLRSAAGGNTRDTRVVAGLRIWF